MWTYRRAAMKLWGLGLGLGASACSLVVDASREQCVVDSDCSRLGADLPDGVCVSSLCRARPDPVWACLEEEDGAAASAVVPSEVRIIVPFVNVVTRQQVPGVAVLACQRLDSECDMPAATGISDEKGEADLRLPGGFNGYLRWQSDTIYPTLFFFGAPLLADAIIPVDVITPEVFNGLNATFANIAIEGRSAVVVNVKNCGGTPAADVRLDVPEGDAATRIFYMVDGLFPPSQSRTSVAGLARLINVPQGNISITGTLPDGREVGTAAVLTRPGFATVTNLGPVR